jgi:hypothetical protein
MACLPAVTSSAYGQTTIEVGATVGLYAPLGSFQPAQAYSMALPNDPSGLSGAALGGQLRVWVAPRLGFQVAATTASSSVGGGNTPNGFAQPVSARVSTATAEVLYRLTGNDSRARVWLGAGGGAVQHGGAAYEPFGNPVNFGGVLGISSSVRVAGPLSAEFGVTTVIYEMNVRGTPATDTGLMERGRQVDALFHTGVSYRWH